MKILLFGASGMVGQGVLRECLLDPGVTLVQIVGRTATGGQHPKLHEVLQRDLFAYSTMEAELTGFDACFFCLGVSSSGMKEPDYAHLTYNLTLALAEPLTRRNPGMTFVYVSGTGTDSTERGRTMWARVKGRTENALLRLPFKAAYMFRPGIIQPLHGARSKTPSYRVLYTLLKPVLPALRWCLPSLVTTTELVGRAMLVAARQGAPKTILENRDITTLARRAPVPRHTTG